MYYLLLYFGNAYRDFMLPEEQSWNGTLTLTQNETGWDEDVGLGVRLLEGACYLTAPSGFAYQGERSSLREMSLRDGMHLVMTRDDKKIAIVVSVNSAAWTVMKKYRLPLNIRVTIGRDSSSAICIDTPLVSAQHGALVRRGNACVYQDSSRNATFYNHQILHNQECTLSVGDTLFIAPALKLVYLGELIAVNAPKELKSIQLSEFQPAPEPSASDSDHQPASALIEYHRAPRLLSRPDVEPIEIEPPLSKSASNMQPLFLTIGPSLTMVLPMLMGSVMTSISNGNGSFVSAGVAMIGTSSLLAVIWALVNSRYRKKQEAATEGRRKKLYAVYLADMEKQLSALYGAEYSRLMRNNLSARECVELAPTSESRLWERMPTHADFMEVRLGLGAVPLPNEIKISKQQLSLIDDPLRDEPKRLKAQYGEIREAPIVLSLRTEPLIGLLGRTSLLPIATSMVVQLAALQSYHDVKIVILTSVNDSSQWEWARWLPHVFPTEDRSLRMVACGKQAVREVLSHLEEVIQMRRDQESAEESPSGDLPEQAMSSDPMQLPLPHYVIFCMDGSLMENEPIMSHLLGRTPGFTLVTAATQMERLPKECRVVVSARKRYEGVYTAAGDVTKLKFEMLFKEPAARFAKRMAPVRVRDSIGNAAIPALVSFLELYHVQDVQALDVWRFWNEHHAYDGLKSDIGLRAGAQPFSLDISDKNHGPHGLVAGTTGSGKSVMLQTYILSLALNYSPEQVQFILIDYKGGGMADAFVGLPHLAGTIDNLQGTRAIQRALASIQGEIRRRETIFKAAGVSNIDEYMRGLPMNAGQEPLSHLIIVVDEFAELKKEQPEFMHELISASRVGRSVGLHLILATQKPSNSVDDEIWSNARFRICLRVQGRSDSMDMLKRPDAAYIKGMGRCYVQIGNDEIFEEVQTSFSGADYQPNHSAALEKPSLLNEAGQRVRVRVQKTASVGKKTTQMTAVLERIAEVVQQHSVAAARRLWLDELPDTIFLSQLTPFARRSYRDGQWPKMAVDSICAYIGMADDLQNQLHIPVKLDFTKDRNYLIVGQGATGKTTLLQTVILSLCSQYTPDQVQLYVLSLSSRTLGSLADLPHVGDIVYDEQPDETARLLYVLGKESERRRELFADASTDNYVAYARACATQPLEPVPAIVVAVDRMVQLTDSLEEGKKQALYTLLREGSSRGIFFLATAMALNEIYTRVRDCFKGVALQLHDRGDYLDVLGRRLPSEMSDIAAVSGRGVVAVDDNVYEMQVALFGQSSTDTERAMEIKRLAKQMDAAWHGARPLPLPRIPEGVTWKAMREQALAGGMDPAVQLPLGYLDTEAVPAVVDLRKQFAWLITGAKNTGKTSFLKGVASLLRDEGAQLHFFGGESLRPFAQSVGGTLESLHADAQKVYREQLEALIIERNQQRKALGKADAEATSALFASFTPYVILIDGMAEVLSVMTPELKHLISECCSMAAGYRIYLFVTVSAGSVSLMRREEMFQNLVSQQSGIALCGRLNDCDAWDVQAPYAVRSRVLPVGQGFMVDRSGLRIVHIPAEIEGGENA